MAWLEYVYTVLAVFHLTNAQVTPFFNDWTASGVEREAEVMFRTIINAQNDVSEIADTNARTEGDVNAIYLNTQKKIYDSTTNNLKAVANLATQAGYPRCAALARLNESAIVVKYQAQVQANNDIFRTTGNKFKASVVAAKSSLDKYSLDEMVALLRGCNSASNNQLQDGVIKCYKKVLQDFTNKLQTVNTTVQSISSEYEAVKRASDDFQTNNNRILAKAKSETDKAVDDTKECVNLNKKSPLQTTLEEIAKLNASTSDYLNTNLVILEAIVNSLISELNLTKSVIDKNFYPEVLPYLYIGQYLIMLNLPAEVDEQIQKQISKEYDNSINKLNELLSNKIFNLINNLVSNKNNYAKYKIELSYVSKNNLSYICVPQDLQEQVSKEEEIKTCLYNLFQKFSKAAQEARETLAQIITDYNRLEEEVSSVIQNDVSAEINKTVERIKGEITSLLTSNGYNPENILQIIETYFSSLKYKNILQNQLNIKANLGKIKLKTESLFKYLDFEIESALSRLVETIKIIPILKPDYNLTDLNTELLKFKTELKNNITSFVNDKYNMLLNIATPALIYNYDAELKLLLKNATVCLPVDLLKLLICFEPLTTAYNKTLHKALRLSINTLIDTNYIAEKLLAEFNQYIELIFNKTKIDARTKSIEALNKVNPGSDYRREAIIQFQDENEKRIKEGSLDTTYDFYVNYKAIVDKLELDLDNLYRPLRLSLEKGNGQVPNQLITFSDQKTPCQMMPNIDKGVTDIIESVRSVLDTMYDGNLLKSLQAVKNTTNLLTSYVTELVNSSCNQYVSSKSLYDECIQDINTKYAASLSVVESNLLIQAYNTDVLLPTNLAYTIKLQNRELKISEDKIITEFKILEQLIKEKQTIQQFLQDSLNNALKEYQDAALYANNINTGFDPTSINTPFAQFQLVLNTSADPIILCLNTIVVPDVTPSPEFQNILENSVANLMILLNDAPLCYKENVTSYLKMAFETANNNIEIFRNQILTSNALSQYVISNYVNFINGEANKYSENAVKENCKTYSIFTLKECIQSYFFTLVNNLKSEKSQVEPIAETFSNATIKTNIDDFIEEIKAQLTKVKEILNIITDKAKLDLTLWNGNKDITDKATFFITNNLTSNFAPLSEQVDKDLFERRREIRSIADPFRQEITTVLSKNGPLTPEKEAIIENYSVVVNNCTTFYTRYINFGSNFLLSYKDLISLSSTAFNRSIKAKCFKESEANDAFNACVQAVIGEYKTVTDEITASVNYVSTYFTNVAVCVKQEIEDIITKALKYAEEVIATETVTTL